MSCNCNKNSYDKVDLNLSCGAKHFAVENYFSELVHEWEKESARYNLGIQELYAIEYGTDGNNDELNTVTFKYRKGHEIITRTFKCAPKGDPGEPGPRGLSAYEVYKSVTGSDLSEEEWLASLHGEKGDDGKPARIGSITIDYVSNCESSAEVVQTNTENNVWTLKLHLAISPVADIVNQTVDALKSEFYNKSEINEKLMTLRNDIELRIKGIYDGLGIDYIEVDE